MRNADIFAFDFSISLWTSFTRSVFVVITGYKFMIIDLTYNSVGPGWQSGLGSWFKLTCTNHCCLYGVSSHLILTIQIRIVLYSSHMIRFVIHKAMMGGSLWVLQLPPPITDWHDMTEILLNVVLNPNQTNVNLSAWF